MLNVRILLDHPDLIFVHECLDVGALFDKPGPDIFALFGLQGYQHVHGQVKNDISVLDLPCVCDQAHQLIHEPG